jgi:GNAT superfamily N-acetyltransferase
MPLACAVPETPSVQEAGLRCLFSRLPADEREAQLVSTLAAVERKEFSLENLCVALDGELVLGAVLAVRRPGGVAFLWPPVVCEGAAADDVARELLETVGRRVDGQQVVFTQCLLDPADIESGAALERGGVPRVTDLILLSRSLTGMTAQSASTELSSECYTAALISRFASIVERTYDGTLDCPSLAHCRSGEESLDSHRATGRFAPEAWRIYRLQGCDVGVLLLAEHPERDTWEVAYLGVIREVRGRGIGRAILQDGLLCAARTGRSAVEIAVDAGNVPALRLYRSLGFFEVRRFAVHLRLGAERSARRNRHVLHSGT